MSLEHCAKILTKNKIRDCDREELRAKEVIHEEIMKETDKDSYELTKELYNEVLKNLKIKNKGMFKLLNKSGDKYKEESDTSAEVIKRIALDETLSIDEVREQIRAEDEKTQKKCFGTVWVGPKKQKKQKKRSSKETKELEL